ncbi:YaaC family protein [uncultured Roseovarius sp.]|uniref:YaaC family protein n=1 Tax=uncultured Roseovarius sp. TaxID=293344 RepID=UPI0026041019|nr:YaaC family protein [uncultured Roseovarius sp.]
MSGIPQETVRLLRPLGSVDLVKRTFNEIHNLTLSTTRAKQIVASYRQGQEYFNNAAKSDISVKPLLLFYGISNLSRSLTLILTARGGEETLSPSHGLSCEGWSNLLETDIGISLPRLAELSVTRCRGLFSSLMEKTENTVFLHTQSSKTDWSASFDPPSADIALSFSDVTSRIPDLMSEYKLWTGNQSLVICVHEISAVNDLVSFKVNNQTNIAEIFQYAGGKLNIKDIGRQKQVEAATDDIPLFLNSFVHQSFGTIPNLFAVSPTNETTTYSQICLSFMLSYFLGMLCRYHPSHWMALSRDGISDTSWPMIEASMDYLEIAYPRMVAECINYKAERNTA